MAKKMVTSANTGKYVFLLGIAVAVIAGLVAATGKLEAAWVGYITLALVLMGIIVGFLNIQPGERQAFLIAAIALSMLGLAAFVQLSILDVGAYITNVLSNVVIFVAPAAAIAALYEIYDLAKA